ncbi:MAG: methionyl-tRNA formyltransferase, partial [Treponemataceae bacterium]
SLLNEVKNQGGALLLEVLSHIMQGTQTDTPQDHDKATFCKMLSKDDGIIDWKKNVQHIDAQIRALYPWPKAFTQINGKKLFLINSAVAKNMPNSDKKAGTILDVNEQGVLIQTGDGILLVSQLQWQAKKILNGKDFFNGNKNIVNLICE